MERQDNVDMNANKLAVPFWTIIIVVTIDAILLVAWCFCVYKYMPCPTSFIIENIPNVIGTLISFSLGVFGVTSVNRGVFSKGGTKYYPRAFGEKKLNDILNGYIETCDENTYHKVQDKIADLLKPMEGYQNHSLYFKYVFQLLDSDWDFAKVWNDFNYYGAKIHPSDKDKEYLYKLRKYIYNKVYQLHIIKNPNDTL